MYRQTDDRKVWYEWMVEVYALERTSASVAKLTTPAMTGIRLGSPNVDSLKNKENAQKAQGGNSYQAGHHRVRVGMSEMHSSIKEGCLM